MSAPYRGGFRIGGFAAGPADVDGAAFDLPAAAPAIKIALNS